MNFTDHERAGETLAPAPLAAEAATIQGRPVQPQLPDTDWKEVPRPSAEPERDGAPEPQEAESRGNRVNPQQLLLW